MSHCLFFRLFLCANIVNVTCKELNSLWLLKWVCEYSAHKYIILFNSILIILLYLGLIQFSFLQTKWTPYCFSCLMHISFYELLLDNVIRANKCCYHYLTNKTWNPKWITLLFFKLLFFFKSRRYEVTDCLLIVYLPSHQAREKV